MLTKLRLLLQISRSYGIARRYFVVNGFDGALTMLGMLIAFYTTDDVSLGIVIGACTGAAIALGMSGITSAYISEVAERDKELRELEQAMVTRLDDAAHGQAARLVPIIIALVNGLAPLLISLFIMLPMLLANYGLELPASPLQLSIGFSFLSIFLLGVFLGNISGTFWLWSGIRTLLIACLTALVIILLTR